MAARPLRRIAVTALLEGRRKRGPRRQQAEQQAIGVPAYSRIIYKSGSVVVR